MGFRDGWGILRFLLQDQQLSCFGGSNKLSSKSTIHPPKSHLFSFLKPTSDSHDTNLHYTYLFQFNVNDPYPYAVFSQLFQSQKFGDKL